MNDIQVDASKHEGATPSTLTVLPIRIEENKVVKAILLDLLEELEQVQNIAMVVLYNDSSAQAITSYPAANDLAYAVKLLDKELDDLLEEDEDE